MPPEPKKRKGWVVALGYTAFGFTAFVLFLYLTFPYEAFRSRLVSEAERAGFKVTIGSIGPGFGGLIARGVRIERPAANPAASPAQATAEILIPRMSFGPSFVPLGLAFNAEVFGGEIEGALGGAKHGSLQLEVSRLDAAKGDLKGLTGLELAGTLDGKVMLTVPLAENTPTREYDLSLTDGRVELEFRDLAINGGTLTMPYMGQPTPFDLPRIHAGTLRAELRFEKGLGTIAELTSTGDDVSLRTEGTLKLARAPLHSDLNLDLKLKAEPEFVKRLGLIGSGLSILPADRTDPAFRVAKITGFVSSPRLVPGGR